MEKKNLEKIYEKFLEDIEPTEEMKNLYEKLSDKLLQIKNLADERLATEVEELEEIYSKLNDYETRAAFYKGFSVATNIILEAKE